MVWYLNFNIHIVTYSFAMSSIKNICKLNIEGRHLCWDTSGYITVLWLFSFVLQIPLYDNKGFGKDLNDIFELVQYVFVHYTRFK